MRRREFMTLLGGAVAWPPVARAQQSKKFKKLPTIGVLGAATPLSWRHWVAAFVQRLGELGWSEGRTVAIEYRWADGRTERFPEIATEFAQMNVDVIVTAANGVLPAKRATSTIPIVFVIANDPVGTGLVESLARPGGNATGLSIQSSDLAGKRLELLREVTPGLRRLAILTNVDYAGAVLEAGEVQDAAHTLGLEVVILEIRRAEDIAPALDKLRGRAQGLYLPSEAIVFTNRALIATLAQDVRLVTIAVVRDYVEGFDHRFAVEDGHPSARRFLGRRLRRDTRHRQSQSLESEHPVPGSASVRGVAIAVVTTAWRREPMTDTDTNTDDVQEQETTERPRLSLQRRLGAVLSRDDHVSSDELRSLIDEVNDTAAEAYTAAQEFKAMSLDVDCEDVVAADNVQKASMLERQRLEATKPRLQEKLAAAVRRK